MKGPGFDSWNLKLLCLKLEIYHQGWDANHAMTHRTCVIKMSLSMLQFLKSDRKSQELQTYSTRSPSKQFRRRVHCCSWWGSAHGNDDSDDFIFLFLVALHHNLFPTVFGRWNCSICILISVQCIYASMDNSFYSVITPAQYYCPRSTASSRTMCAVNVIWHDMIMICLILCHFILCQTRIRIFVYK